MVWTKACKPVEHRGPEGGTMSRGERARRRVKRKKVGPQEALEATKSITLCVLVQREADQGLYTGTEPSPAICFILIKISLVAQGQSVGQS